MNFDLAAGPMAMPELGWRYGYPAGLLILFRGKGWIGKGKD
jgi:magnesium transporter